MGFQKIDLSALAKLTVGIATLVTTISISFPSSLAVKVSIPKVVAQAPANRKTEADQLFQHGFQQFQSSQFEGALGSWLQALNIYREIGDRIGESKTLGNIGNAYFALGNYTKVIEYSQQSLTIALEINQNFLNTPSSQNINDAYQAIMAALNALGNMGNAEFALGNYSKASQYYQRILYFSRELQDRKLESGALASLGNVYIYLGNYGQAITFYQQSLIIAQELKDYEQEAAIQNNLGNVYLLVGDYGQAIEHLQESLAIARRIRNISRQEEALGSLGNAYSSLGDYNRAINYYLDSLSIAKEVNDIRGEGAALGNLATAYFSVGDYPKAIEYYDQSLALARSIKNIQGEQDSLGGLSNIYYFLGNYDKAIEYRQQSLIIAKQIRDLEGEGKSLGSLALIYKDRGDYIKALEYQQQGLSIARNIKNIDMERLALHNLGLILFKSGKLIQAEENLLNAIKISESTRAKIGNRDNEKVSLFDTQLKSYLVLQDVLIANNKPEAALEIAERGRGRAFLDLLIRRVSAPLTEQEILNVPTPSIEEIQDIAKKQNATIVQYSLIYEDARPQGKLQAQASKLFVWVIQPTGKIVFRRLDIKSLLGQQNITLPDLVPRIRDAIGVRGGGNANNEVAFKPSDFKQGDFVVLKEDSAGAEPWQVVSVNSETGQLTIRLLSSGNSSEPIPVPISAVARIVDSPNAQSPELQIGYQILISPIADLLPTNPNDRVIFIPQGELFFVPFAALQDANGDYLIKKHTILTAPSIQVLDSTNKLRHSRQISPNAPVLVIGNPSPMPKPFEPLKYAEPEAREIARLLNAQPIIGTQATESAIVNQMPNARIIHLATHGKFDDVRGLGSAIALGSSGKDDGLLTAEEILNLKLNAELVVLSACDTGRGRLTGDGVIGLSRSLIAAGVPSVIVSLWKVPDDTTGVLMTEFYRNLQNNPDKAAAIRSAMLATMEKHPKPIDWAAFTLIGEAE